MNKEQKKLLNKLIALKDVSVNELEKYVIDYVLDEFDSYDNIKDFFNDLQVGGCVGKMINPLIYTEDCQRFYDKYYDEIEDIIKEIEDNQGEPIKVVNGDRKTYYARLGFEEMALQLANKLNLEI